MSPPNEGRRPLAAWVLSREGFDRLLAAIDPDRERAAERYEVLRTRLLKFFRWRGCDRAEELADETFDRMARRIGEGVEIWTGDPSSYLLGIARRVAQEQWRRPREELPVLEAVLRTEVASPAPDAREDDASRRLDCLDPCLTGLPPGSRAALEHYHRGRGVVRIRARQALARELGVSANALRIRMFRLRAGLLECIEACVERGRRNRSAGEA